MTRTGRSLSSTEFSDISDISKLSSEAIHRLVRELQTRNAELSRENGELRSSLAALQSKAPPRNRPTADKTIDKANNTESTVDTASWNQAFLDAFPCVAMLLRQHTREIVAFNNAAAKYGAQEGKTCYETWGQRYDPCPWCPAELLWESGQAQHSELEAAGVVWDTHWIPVESDLYMHYAFDITERKRAENAFQEAIRHLKRSHNQTQALLKGTKALLECKDFHESLRHLCLACRDLIEATTGFVVLVSEVDQKPEFLLFGEDGLQFKTYIQSGIPAEGIFARAYESGRVVFDNKCADSQIAQYFPEDVKIVESLLCAPLVINGVTVGLLGLANRPGGFNSNDGVLAGTFAELASIGLMNPRTLESLEQSEERIRRLIEAAPLGITIAVDGRYSFVNPAFVRMFGYESVDQIVGLPVESVCTLEDLPETKSPHEERSSPKQRGFHYQGVGTKRDGWKALPGGTHEV